MDPLDAAPEMIVEASYLQAFQRLSRRVRLLAVALVIAMAGGGYAVWGSINDGQRFAAERSAAHDDTQAQIKELACGLVDQIPPDHGLADYIRVKYMCGPYVPHHAVVQPKPGKG